MNIRYVIIEVGNVPVIYDRINDSSVFKLFCH